MCSAGKALVGIRDRFAIDVERGADMKAKYEVECDGDTVASISKKWFGVRGIGSGVESDDRMAWVITLRNGKIVRHCGFGTAEEALEAVGLPAREGPATAGPAASR